LPITGIASKLLLMQQCEDFNNTPWFRNFILLLE